MRDLAKQNYSSRKIAIPRSVVRITAIVIIVAVAGFVAKTFLFSPNSGDSSVILRDAPKGLSPVSISGTGIDIGEGVDLTQENASFTNVSDISGTATAVRTYGDGSYGLSGSAQIPDP